jgi:hypothetical protein
VKKFRKILADLRELGPTVNNVANYTAAARQYNLVIYHFEALLQALEYPGVQCRLHDPTWDYLENHVSFI